MGKKIRHIRRIHNTPTAAGTWQIRCDCGWHGEVNVVDFETRREIDDELNRLFVEHVPARERQTYVLVDQRPGGRLGDNDDEPDIGRGNFIMPEGKPCLLLRWYEQDGLYMGKVRGFSVKDPELTLVIGEIRLADGRVFRCG